MTDGTSNLTPRIKGESDADFIKRVHFAKEKRQEAEKKKALRKELAAKKKPSFMTKAQVRREIKAQMVQQPPRREKRRQTKGLRFSLSRGVERLSK